ncbi:MAG: hypothetical protein U1E10_17385, partial [Bdellovibrionales bacterium]|nr:hypothetical protein [Bdellovibrionales bacterium]
MTNNMSVHARRFLTSIVVAPLLGFLLNSNTAFAGERLLLRTGSVDLTNASEATDLLRLPEFDTAESEETMALSARAGKPVWVGTKEKRPKKKADSRATRHFVVQVRDSISKADLINFQSLKLKIIRYLPENAVVVSGSHRQALVLAKSSNRIRAITSYRPEWKLAPEIGASSVFSGDPLVKAVVRF